SPAEPALTLDLLDGPGSALRRAAAVPKMLAPSAEPFPLLAVGWLLVAVTLTGCVGVRWRQLLRRIESDQVEPPAWLYDVLTVAARRVRLRPTPRVIVGQHGPAVFGLVQPTVLLPADALHTMSRADIEHVLMHELAHVKRGDLVLS